MKASLPLVLSFVLPFGVAANAHAEEPLRAAPPSVTPVVAPAAPAVTAPAAPAPIAPAPVLGTASPAPATALPPSPLLQRRSEGLRTAGIVMIPLGSIGFVGGSFVALFSGLGDAVDSTEESARRTRTARIGVATMGLGALVLTGGIIMAAVGSKKVPVLATEAHAAPPRWSVEPLVGVGTAGAKVYF